MTKAEEIKLIHEFYNSLPKDSYLYDILKGVPEECEQQIQSDFAIPYIETIANLTDKSQENLKLYQTAEKELQEERKRNEILLKEMEDLQKGYENYIDDLKNKIKEQDRDLDNANNQLYKELHHMEQENILLNKDMDKMEIEIMRLKARIFDLMEAQDGK